MLLLELAVDQGGQEGVELLVEVAAESGISPETLRKIETGRIPTPAFFTVAALAQTLGLSLDELVTPGRSGARQYGRTA